jgi:hypothetical protein
LHFLASLLSLPAALRVLAHAHAHTLALTGLRDQVERLNNRIYEHAGEIEDLKYKAELQLQEQMYIMSYVAQRRKLAYADSEAPAAEEIREYASYLGIDPELDAKWLWIAEEAISCPLPPSWEGMQDDNGAPFFYNKQVRACMCASVITAGSSLISLLRHADVVVSLCCVVLCCADGQEPVCSSDGRILPHAVRQSQIGAHQPSLQLWPRGHKLLLQLHQCARTASVLHCLRESCHSVRMRFYVLYLCRSVLGTARSARRSCAQRTCAWPRSLRRSRR